MRGSVLFSPLLIEEETVAEHGAALDGHQERENEVYEIPAAEGSRPSLSYSVESLEELEAVEERWPLRMGVAGTGLLMAKEYGLKGGKDIWGGGGIGMGLNNEGAGLRRARSLRWMRERVEDEVGLREEIELDLGWVAGVVV